VLVSRSVAKDGVAESWATNALGMAPGVRRHHAAVRVAIEDEHRQWKKFFEAETCQVRSERARRHPLGRAIRAFLRREWHVFTTGVSAFEARLRPVRDAVRSDLARPAFTWPPCPTA